MVLARESRGALIVFVIYSWGCPGPTALQTLGQPELATSPLFATNEARTENAEALFAILQGQFESRDLDDWRTLFKQSDIKWAPMPKLEEVVQDPQMRAAGAFVDYPDNGSASSRRHSTSSPTPWSSPGH